jgi:hypothetical protein
MIRGLLWRAEPRLHEVSISHISRRAKPYWAPTCSRVSIDLSHKPPAGGSLSACSSYISYEFASWTYDEPEAEERFTFLEAACQVQGANPHGCVTDGHILAKGAVIATTLHYKDGDERRKYLNNFKQYPFGLSISGSTNRYYFDFNVRDEGEDHIPEGSTVSCYSRRLCKVFPGTDYAILLVASKRKPGRYLGSKG